MEKIMGSENELFGVLINDNGEAKGAIFTLLTSVEGYVNLFIAAFMRHLKSSAPTRRDDRRLRIV